MRVFVAVTVSGAIALAACSDLVPDRSRTTWRRADELSVHISNNGQIEHYEDMSTANLGAAAIEEGAEIVELKTIPAESSDSIYQWTRLTILIEGVKSGFPDRTVVECWTLVFEGKFLRDGPDFVDCPPTPQS